VKEGQLPDRVWGVVVEKAVMRKVKNKEVVEQVEKDALLVLATLTGLGGSFGLHALKTKFKKELDISPNRVEAAIDALEADERVERCQVEVEIGKGGRRKSAGIAVVGHSEGGVPSSCPIL
jgi:hypothetical protein